MKTSKIRRSQLLATTLVLLMPMAVGLLFYPQLPERMPTHFTLTGQVNGTSPKFEAVVLLPLMSLAFQVLLVWALSRQQQAIRSTRVQTAYLWLLPILFSFINLSIYGSSLDLLTPDLQSRLMLGAVGLLFLIIGNYLPKLAPNPMLGIRLPWTLNNVDNWMRTHRLAGRLWTLGGLVLLVDACLPRPMNSWLWVVLGLMLGLPCLYSFVLSRRTA